MKPNSRRMFEASWKKRRVMESRMGLLPNFNSPPLWLAGGVVLIMIRSHNIIIIIIIFIVIIASQRDWFTAAQTPFLIFSYICILFSTLLWDICFLLLPAVLSTFSLCLPPLFWPSLIPSIYPPTLPFLHEVDDIAVHSTSPFFLQASKPVVWSDWYHYYTIILLGNTMPLAFNLPHCVVVSSTICWRQCPASEWRQWLLFLLIFLFLSFGQNLLSAYARKRKETRTLWRMPGENNDALFVLNELVWLQPSLRGGDGGGGKEKAGWTGRRKIDVKS